MFWRKSERSKIYIVPTAFGCLYLGGSVTMILIGSAYQNNLVNLMGFFLLAFSFTAMVATQRNLDRIQFLQLDPIEGFSKEMIPISVSVRNRSKKISSSHIHFKLPSPFKVEVNYNARAKTAPGQVQRLTATVKSPDRGLYTIDRVRLETRYPYGLFLAWSQRAAQTDAVIYPARNMKAQFQVQTLSSIEDGNSTSKHTLSGSDFDDLKPFLGSEAVLRMDWKAYARKREAVLKIFSEPTAQVCRLAIRPQYVDLATQESELEDLTTQVSLASAHKVPIEFRTPFEQLGPSVRIEDRKRILRILAGWAQPKKSVAPSRFGVFS